MPWDPPSLLAGETLVPLVSAQAYCDWYGLGTYDELDTATQTRIEMALDMASAEIRNGRRIFTAVNGDSQYVDGSGRPSFLTPRDLLPVTTILSIQELRFDTLETVDSGFYDWDEDGIVTLNGRGHWFWTDRRRGLLVSYSHGYSVIPSEVSGICLAYAHRLYTNPSNQAVVSEQLGDARVEYVPGSGLQADEKESLRLYEVIR